MGKLLLTKKNVNDFILENEKKIYIGENMILTSGAKDVIRNKGLVIVYGEREEPQQNIRTDIEINMESVKASIRKILREDYFREDYFIEDEDNISKIVESVLKKLKY